MKLRSVSRGPLGAATAASSLLFLTQDPIPGKDKVPEACLSFLLIKWGLLKVPEIDHEDNQGHPRGRQRGKARLLSLTLGLDSGNRWGSH